MAERSAPSRSPASLPASPSRSPSGPRNSPIGRDRPQGANVVPGEVEGLAYFGKDSLYRVRLPGGRVLSVNAVNARRAGEGDRVADWSDRVWLGFAPDSAILLTA